MLLHIIAILDVIGGRGCGLIFTVPRDAQFNVCGKYGMSLCHWELFSITNSFYHMRGQSVRTRYFTIMGVPSLTNFFLRLFIDLDFSISEFANFNYHIGKRDRSPPWSPIAMNLSEIRNAGPLECIR